MSETNPNTTVTEEMESVSAPGDGATFEDADLENLFLNPEHRARGGGKKESKSKDDGKETKAKDLGAPNVENAQKPPKAQGKADSERGKEKESDDSGKGKEAKAQVEEQKPRKSFKGKAGDQDIDLDEEAEFFVKIDGEEVPVKASDLFSNYSGKVAWDKRFNELNKTRRGHMSEVQKLNEIKTQVRSMFEEQDPNLRLFKLAQISGVSPMEFRKNFFDQMIPEVENYMNMTEDERKARDLEFENQFLKYQTDAAQKTLAEQQAQRELETRVKSLTRQHGVTDQQFRSTLENIVSSIDDKQRAMFEAEGKFVSGYPTPEFIIEVVQKESLWEAASSALEGVKLDWDAQTKGQNLLNLVEDAYRNGIKPSDMPEIVSELWGKSRAKRVVERVERERQEHYEGKKPAQYGSPQDREVWSFEQI